MESPGTGHSMFTLYLWVACAALLWLLTATLPAGAKYQGAICVVGLQLDDTFLVDLSDGIGTSWISNMEIDIQFLFLIIKK